MLRCGVMGNEANRGIWFLESLGQAGDATGSVTSLFTGLGFVGLVVTLLLQQKQIRQLEKQITESRGPALTSSSLNWSASYRPARLLASYIRVDRKRIPHTESPAELKDLAARVCAGFNLAAILANRDPHLKDLIVDSYYASAIKTRHGLHDLIMDIRKNRTENFCLDFDRLVEQMSGQPGNRNSTGDNRLIE